MSKASAQHITSQGRNWRRFQTAKRLFDVGGSFGNADSYVNQNRKHFADALGTYAGRDDGGGYGNRLAVEQFLHHPQIAAALNALEGNEDAQRAAAEGAARSHREGQYSSDMNAANSYKSYSDRANELKNYLNQQRANVENLSYQPYSGQTTTNMSDLTKRMEELQNQMSDNGYSFQREFEQLRNRTEADHGLQDTHKRSINDFLNERNERFKQETADRFKNSFRTVPSEERIRALRNSQDEEINKYAPTFNESLGHWGEDLGLGNQQHNLEKMFLISKLANATDDQKRELIGLLGEAGDKDHAIGNMKLKANEQNFYNQQGSNKVALKKLEEEANPVISYGNLASLETDNARNHALNRRNALEAGETDIGPYQYHSLKAAATPATDIEQLKRVYEAQKNSTPLIKVADKTQSLRDAQGHLLRANANPSRYQENQLQNLMVNPQDSNDEMVNRGINSFRHRMDYEDKKFQEELEAEALAIGNKYGRLANSPGHMREVQNLIANRTAERDIERKKTMMSGLDRQRTLGKIRGDINLAGTKLASIGDANALRHQLEQLNIGYQRGLRDWNSSQDEEERKTQDQFMQRDMNFPGLKSLMAQQRYSTAPLSRNNYSYTR